MNESLGPRPIRGWAVAPPRGVWRIYLQASVEKGRVRPSEAATVRIICGTVPLSLSIRAAPRQKQQRTSRLQKFRARAIRRLSRRTGSPPGSSRVVREDVFMATRT